MVFQMSTFASFKVNKCRTLSGLPLNTKMSVPNRKPRLLLSSYVCDPVTSMEARLGWHRARTAAEEFDVTVICDSLNRQHIEAHAREHGNPPFQIQFVEPPKIEERLASLPGLFYWGYHRFHKRALTIARELHRQLPFDLVHQVGLCAYREPSYLWKLGVPFIWGPIGGAQNFPLRFLGTLSPYGAAYELIRNVINWTHLHYRTRIGTALREAEHVFAANSITADKLYRAHGIRPELQLETGIETLPNVKPNLREKSRPIRILWSGRLKHWKALPLLFRALGRIRGKTSFELRIIGHEQDSRSLRRLASHLGIDKQVHWLGWPVYRDALQHYEWADVFVFTSLRDTSGTGLLEALAHGCPIIGVDHQGARDIMREDCSVLVPVTHPAETIQAFATALTDLADDSNELLRLSEGAVQRARDFTWSAHWKKMLATYWAALERDVSPSVVGHGRRTDSSTTRSGISGLAR